MGKRKKTIGDKLRDFRHDAGYTQVEVAEHLGVSQARVSAWEADLLGGLYPERLLELCDLLEVTPNQVLL